MDFINTTATVSDSHELELRVPTRLAAGEYSVVVRVDGPLDSRVARAPLTYGSLRLGDTGGASFHREDIYADDGR